MTIAAAPVVASSGWEGLFYAHYNARLDSGSLFQRTECRLDMFQ